jgi:hypothetical protein
LSNSILSNSILGKSMDGLVSGAFAIGNDDKPNYF